MGCECNLLSYVVGLVPLGYGIRNDRREMYLFSWSQEPIRGSAARELGYLTILIGVAYYLTITWAWSFYKR